MNRKIQNARVLVTGGAGFIGSNLVEVLLQQDNEVVVLDNFMTGHRKNIEPYLANPRFTLIEGDIRDLATCHQACHSIDYVLHQAAIGSVPRSIADPILSADVNEMGFLNILVAARDAKVKRFVYAASSSTYGDSEKLPKIENEIGKPLSPYAITKYVNELYAENFGRLYGTESPIINGDGSYSRDFTYIHNVLQINQIAATTENKEAINTVYNTAFGERTNLNEMTNVLKQELSKFDPAIGSVDVIHGPERVGDIPHSQANISKARKLLGYTPSHDFSAGIKETAEWYFNNLISGRGN